MIQSPSTGPDLSTGTPTDQLLEFLRDPSSYPETTHAVEIIETHISWVFLTDRFAFKLKKPVKFEFLDFRSPERRKQACEDEVRLNRRLAPDTYIGVIPIIRSEGRYAFQGNGAPVDWLVKMRRLPADRAMHHMIQARSLTGEHVDSVAARFAEFYRSLPPLPMQTESYLNRLQRHVLANREELMSTVHQLPVATVKRSQAAQLRALRLLSGMFQDRVRDGRIVEGHGDLRPEHVYLLPSGPCVIDCLEFSRELREVDGLDELSFFAVECSHLGASGFGGQVLDYYCQTCLDVPPAELLAFYMSYRASVRAKVHVLRAQQIADAEARTRCQTLGERYLALADQSAKVLESPVMILVRGLSGTGKSTLAIAISELLGLDILHTDTIRREVFGPHREGTGYDDSRYTPENRARIYDELFRRAEFILRDGLSVVLDGTFLTTSSRAQAVQLARRLDVLPIVIHCQCPGEIARERAESRANRCDSDATATVHDDQARAEEPDPPGVHAYTVSTIGSVPALVQEVFEHLAAVLFPSARSRESPRKGNAIVV